MSIFNERECWTKFTGGDKKAFEALYHEYYDTLISYGLRLKNDIHLVEETLQDLFIKLWQNRQNLNRPSSLTHYLLKSLRNALYNKSKSLPKELYVGDEQDILHFELHLPKEGSDYPQKILKQLMDGLTARQKEAVYLFYLEGLSYQEIADLLKINIGGTYKLMYRALEKMKTGFKKQQAEHLTKTPYHIHPKTS